MDQIHHPSKGGELNLSLGSHHCDQDSWSQKQLEEEFMLRDTVHHVGKTWLQKLGASTVGKTGVVSADTCFTFSFVLNLEVCIHGDSRRFQVGIQNEAFYLSALFSMALKSPERHLTHCGLVPGLPAYAKVTDAQAFHENDHIQLAAYIKSLLDTYDS